jgi:hypothetical protein
VAQCLHSGGDAGRELGVAPAVASARLAKLENEVGADLLRRSTRKVALSLEGAEFRNRAIGTACLSFRLCPVYRSKACSNQLSVRLRL